VSERLPFNKRDRKRLCYQAGYGFRGTNDWGSGNLPGPYAEGDIVQLIDVSKTDDRLTSRMPAGNGEFFVVCAGFSIGEGDDWYYRVSKGEGASDRLHVISGDVDYMTAFRLVDTADPDGLGLREWLLAGGWEPPTCEQRGCFCDCHAVGIQEKADPILNK
jgi:hypothetical protein